MRELLLLVVVVGSTVMLAEGQVLHGPRGAPPHRPLYPSASPFSQGPQLKPRLPLPGGSGPASHGPSPQGGPFVGNRPQSFQFQQMQGVGQLPLNPRPNFEEDFQPQEDVGFSEDEVALQGGDFSPLFSDEQQVEPARENVDQGFSTADLSAEEPQEHSLPSTSQEETQPQEGVKYEEAPETEEPTQSSEEYEPQVTTQYGEDLSQVTTLQQEEPQVQQPPYQPPRREEPLLGSPEQPRHPQHQLSEAEEVHQKLGRQQYEQETQDVLEIISLPRPIHRPNRWRPRPRPQFEAIHRRPTHPNQLPLVSTFPYSGLYNQVSVKYTALQHIM